MKRILLFLACSFIGVTLYADAFTPTEGYPYRVAISSSASTELFSKADVNGVHYKNKTGYNVYLTTYSYVPGDITTAANVYVLETTTNESETLTLNNSNFRFAISSAATPSASSLWLTVDK